LEGIMDGWDAERYATNARFVSDLGLPVVTLLAPKPGERILDLGCGDGALTETLAASGARVVGVDGSPNMVAAARIRGLDARVMDAQALAFAAEFDAVFSNAALHWMSADPGAVIDGVARALVPGGRFVAEMGGHGNVAAIVTALVAVLARRGIDGAARIPWYFPTAADYRALLESRGFMVAEIALFPRPTPLATGMEAWLATFAEGVLADLPEEERRTATAEATALLAPALRDSRRNWTADYVRLRFRAVRR
jgi:trans-aconitate methyltransferase